MNEKKKRQRGWEKVKSKLEVADIILAREKKMISKIITKGTESYWSHVLIVYAIPEKRGVFKNTLVMSAEPNGIEIHKIEKFSKQLDYTYDLGVKRVPGLSDETKERVISFMSNNVDIPYDYTRLLSYFINYIKNLFKLKRNEMPLKNFLVHKDTFICSSFIQKAFYEAMPNNKKKLAIFGQNNDLKFFLEDITPADIARSKNCKWIYNPHD